MTQRPRFSPVELNFWLTGKGSTRYTDSKRADLVRELKDGGLQNPDTNALVADRITKQLARLAGEYGLDPQTAPHILHHWPWDRAKGTETTHAGMMEAQTSSPWRRKSVRGIAGFKSYTTPVVLLQRCRTH